MMRHIRVLLFGLSLFAALADCSWAGNTMADHSSLTQLLPEEFGVLAEYLDPSALNAVALTGRAGRKLVRQNRFEPLTRRQLRAVLGDPKAVIKVSSYPMYQFLKTQGWWTGMDAVDFEPTGPGDCIDFLSDPTARAEVKSLTLHFFCSVPEATEKLKEWSGLRALRVEFDAPSFLQLYLRPWGALFGHLSSLESLELRSSKTANTEGILHGLHKLRKLRHIGLREFHLSASDAQALAATSLTSFAYEGSSEFLVEFLPKVQDRLEELDFASPYHGVANREEAWASALAQVKGLKKLKLTAHELVNLQQGASWLGAARKLTSLESFSFQGGRSPGIGEALAQVLNANRALTEVRLVDVLSTEAAGGDEFAPVFKSLSALPKLKVLEFSWDKRLHDRGVLGIEAFLEALGNSEANLKTLQIQGYHLTLPDYPIFRSVFSELEGLDLSESGLRFKKDALSLMRALASRKLKTLNLDSFAFAEEGLGRLRLDGYYRGEGLFDVIADKFPALRTLVVGGDAVAEELSDFHPEAGGGMKTLRFLEWRTSQHAREPKVDLWSVQFPNLMAARLFGCDASLMSWVEGLPRLEFLELVLREFYTPHLNVDFWGNVRSDLMGFYKRAKELKKFRVLSVKE